LARFYFEKRYFLPFKSRKSLKLKDLRAGGGRGRKSLALNGLGYRKRPAETKWRKARRGALLVTR